MSIFGGVKSQLRSVIQWDNPHPNSLFERWSANGDEIKNASKLIVGPGQGCIFVYEGKVEGVYTQEGIVELKTANIPFWTTITKFMQAFVSEHKVGLYYFKTTQILDQKWGTNSIIKYDDPKYKFPVGLRAFGNFSFRITDPKSFFVNIVGGANPFLVDNFRQVMVSRMIQPLTDYLAEGRHTYAEIDAQREEISAGVNEKLKSEFVKLGFELVDFRIEGTSFDEDTMKRINRVAEISAEAMAADVAGVSFAQLQQLQAMKDAAKNQGGAGMGMGMGIGMAFGQNINAQGAVPQPEDPTMKLKKLKQMVDDGLITQEEYDIKKKDILAKM
jgi:membrane protease subunit (stomatin/prohibitin family)